jgi:copper ion binding protein
LILATSFYSKNRLTASVADFGIFNFFIANSSSIMETATINPTSTTKQTFPVEGMTCGGCVNGVQRALSRVAGVSAATVDLKTASATVEYDPTIANFKTLQSAVDDAGYDLKAPGSIPSASAKKSGGGCCG